MIKENKEFFTQSSIAFFLIGIRSVFCKHEKQLLVPNINLNCRKAFRSFRRNPALLHTKGSRHIRHGWWFSRLSRYKIYV